MQGKNYQVDASWSISENLPWLLDMNISNRSISHCWSAYIVPISFQKWLTIKWYDIYLSIITVLQLSSCSCWYSKVLVWWYPHFWYTLSGQHVPAQVGYTKPKLWPANRRKTGVALCIAGANAVGRRPMYFGKVWDFTDFTVRFWMQLQ